MAKGKAEPEKLKYYRQVAERSFKTVFDQYLFFRYSRGKQLDISYSDFKTFRLTQEIINEYVNEYWQEEYDFDKNGIWVNNIKKIGNDIYEWEKKKDNEEIVKDCYGFYLNTRFIEIYPYEKFKELVEKKTCYYCSISEDDIELLISKHKIFKKKLTRGWTLEIDRRLPNLEYTDENCVRCCYWCNSAKTDEFDDIEFQPIGDAIKQIWHARLNR